MNEKIIQQAKELANRPYFIKWTLDETTDDQPIYLAHVPEFEGCFGQGKTAEAAVTDLRAAMVDFIASLLEDGLPVPGPAELTSTTSSTIDKTFMIKGHSQDNNLDTFIPHRNIYLTVE